MNLIIFIFLIYVHSLHAWSFDPSCWIGKCTKKSQPAEQPLAPPNIFKKLINPGCWFSNCMNEKKSTNQVVSNSWFPNCDQQNLEQNVPEEVDVNDNTLFGWFGSKVETVKTVKTQDEHWYCNLKQTSREALEDLKDYLNAAKPQKTIIENIYSAELSPYCWFNECCNLNSIPGNTEKLRIYLKKHVYGQPIVDIIIDAIYSHWNSNVEPKKALVMSFHGSVGTGKNYVADFIAKSLFKLGGKSKHVHHFSGRVHVTLDSADYKNSIYQWLKGNVTDCPKQLFVFDEVDKMPESVLNGLKPMLDYKESVDGSDYRNAIFIFISNTGAGLIENHYGELLRSNKEKKDIQLNDFEKLIANGAFHEKGGFHNSDAIKYNLIDHYIPFLPLEKEEVTKCIIDSFNERKVSKPLDEHVEMVLEYLEQTHMIVKDRLIYSNGCKQVFGKVGFIVAKYYKFHDKAVDFTRNDL